MLFRKKTNILFLALLVAGSSIQVYGTDRTAWAKQKVRDVREKAHNAYVVTCEKTRALYEKAKENKKLIAGIVTGAVVGYLGIETILSQCGNPTLYNRIFKMPGDLHAAQQAKRAAKQARKNLQQQLDTANQDLIVANQRNNDVVNNIAGVRLGLERDLNENIDELRRVRQEAEERLEQLNERLNLANQERENALAIQNELRNAYSTHQVDALVEEERLQAEILQHTRRIEDLNQQLVQQANLSQQEQQAIQQQLGQAQQQLALAQEAQEQIRHQEFHRGRAHNTFEQKQKAIAVTLDNLMQGLYMTLDKQNDLSMLARVGNLNHIIITLAQATLPEFNRCAEVEHLVHPEQAGQLLLPVYNQIVELAQNSINNAFNIITDDAQSLENYLTEYVISGEITTKDIADAYIVDIHRDLSGHFQRLFIAFDQLAQIVQACQTNDILKLSLGEYGSKGQAILLSLENIILHYSNSVGKIAHFTSETDILVKSPNDYCNFYKNSLIVHFACKNYETFLTLFAADDVQEQLKFVHGMQNQVEPIIHSINSKRVFIENDGTSESGELKTFTPLERPAFTQSSLNNASKINDINFDSYVQSTLSPVQHLDNFEEVMRNLDQQTEQTVHNASHLGSNISFNWGTQSLINTNSFNNNSNSASLQDLDSYSQVMYNLDQQTKKTLNVASHLGSSVNNQSMFQSSIMNNNSKIDGSKIITSALWGSQLPKNANRDRKHNQDAFVGRDSWINRSPMSTLPNIVVPKGGTNSQCGATSPLSNNNAGQSTVITNKNSAETHSLENDRPVRLDPNYVYPEIDIDKIVITQNAPSNLVTNVNNVATQNNVDDVNQQTNVSIVTEKNLPVLLPTPDNSSDDDSSSDNDSIDESTSRTNVIKLFGNQFSSSSEEASELDCSNEEMDADLFAGTILS